MAFIRTIPENEAAMAVREMYDTELGSRGYILNYTKVFSHRPEIMAAWDTLCWLRLSRLRSSYCMLAHGSILQERSYYTQ